MLAISCVFLSFSSAPVPDGGAGVCVTGCSPYTEPPFPTWSHMVSEMSKECKLMVHVGDTKSGSGVCDDDLMAGPLRIMVATGTPTLYTLGDNEATPLAHHLVYGEVYLTLLTLVRRRTATV